jgi:putative protease
MAEAKVGRVTQYFSKAGVAGVQVTDGPLSVGDAIHIKGHTTDFTQVVESMQVEHAAIQRAEVGQLIGLRVTERVREHDVVYRVTPDA